MSAILTCLMILFRTLPLAGQISQQQNALASWIQLDMPTGYETRISPHVAIEMNGWSSDQWGNLTMTVGSGGTKTVVACGLDRPSYSVSQITKDGYLRVHRIGRGPSHPLWDQAHEAQTVRILTKNGPVAGVVARSNGHFNQQHSEETNIVTADDLWVDVGVETQAQVAALGIELLDPLSRHLPRWSYNGHVAGPDAGARASCAAVATLAQYSKNNPPKSAETISFVLSSQKEFGWIGLSSFLSRKTNVDKLIILGDGEPSRIHEIRPNSSFGRLEPILVHSGIAQVDWISPTVREIGSHMESISMNESDWLLTQTAALVGRSLNGYPTWIEKRLRPVRS